MSELTERLAAIREFADRPFTTGIDDADQHVCDQSADIQALLAAVEAVLELHSLDDQEECAVCVNQEGDPRPWPCPTIQAIEEAA